MSVKNYLSKTIASQLAQELEPILKVKGVTRNSELLGAYAEAALRRLSSRVVHPLRVSTGAVIDYPMPKTLRQIDLILWAPFPAPSIFEVGDFGLVPRSSAFGAIEIKRSNYQGAVSKLEEFVKKAPGLIAASEEAELLPRVMGVICVIEKKPSSRLEKLFKSGSVVALFDKQTSKVVLRPKDVLRLVNFLHRVNRCYRRQSTLGQHLELRTDF